MPINPVIAQRLVQVRQALDATPHGSKQVIYQAACSELGMSLATLHRQIGKVTMKTPRKKRSDAGSVALSREEALAISALLMISHRKNQKRLMSISKAVGILRANNEVRAERIDPQSGEIKLLSESAIARALRHYALHPDQLNRPAPAVELKSLHPNHVWEIDASLCVLYYLHARTEKERGLQVMEYKKFYKNKPQNLKRIESERVWSYEATDHYSGTIKVRYVLGAESAANLSDSFIEFTQQREGSPVHGVPFILMMDRGSANTSGLFSNLARRLQVKTIAHAPGNARATGQVEKARDIIERSFESCLRLRPVQDLDDLNVCAQRWANWYNGTQILDRHGQTRYAAWMSIKAEQLRVAPSVEMCRALLTDHPEEREVSDQLTVTFNGSEYDVAEVPNVMLGEKLLVARNPYAPAAVQIVLHGSSTDAEALHTAPLVIRDEAGFRLDANVIGEDYKRRADTQLDTNRKEVERYAYGAQTDEGAAAARKAKALPFGGRIDPFKVIDQSAPLHYLPRKGTALQPKTQMPQMPPVQQPQRTYTHFEAGQWLTVQGLCMDNTHYSLMRQWYPSGVPEADLPELALRLARPTLRAVGAA